MSSALVTIYPTSVAYNSVTYDKSSGGPLQVMISFGGNPLPDWTGDAFYAEFNAAVNGFCNVGVMLRAPNVILVPNTKASLVCIFGGKSGGTTMTLTFTNMVYFNASPIQQGRGTPGSIMLNFGHESGDGTTVPIVAS
jgi:hypothetical protein